MQAAESTTLAMRVFLWALTGPNVKPKTLLQTWEAKMPVDVFDARGVARRAKRRKVKNVALLRLIGNILTLLFYVFVLIGAVVVVGVLFISPVIAMFVAACVLAALLAAMYEFRQGKKEGR
jgi:hypothetical protein